MERQAMLIFTKAITNGADRNAILKQMQFAADQGGVTSFDVQVNAGSIWYGQDLWQATSIVHEQTSQLA